MLGDLLTTSFDVNHSMVEGIRVHVVKRGKRNVLSRYFNERDDKKAIAAWKVDLGQIRGALTVCPSLVSA
jgi:hypothetical protein